MIWRLFKDLDPPEYGRLKILKIENEALKNNALSSLGPMDENPDDIFACIAQSFYCLNVLLNTLIFKLSSSCPHALEMTSTQSKRTDKREKPRKKAKIPPTAMTMSIPS